jgi:hypothetical protein
MQQLFFLRRLFLFSLLLCCGFNTYAASVSDLKTSYPSDFGSVLVGGAVIKPNTVQWAGTDSTLSVSQYGNSTQFGLTGNVIYMSEINADIVNTWVMGSPQNTSLLIPIPSSAPSMGYFFAPYQAGLQTNTDSYYLNYSSQTLIKTVNVQGTGVADEDILHPKLTLDVSVQGGVVNGECADMQNCKYVDVLPGGVVTFTVIPQKKTGTNVDYAFVNIQTDEIGVDCTSGNFTFNDKGVSQNGFELNDYYQALTSTGPTGAMQAICYARAFSAIKSIGKSFQFSATNLRDTKAGGYAQYRFFLNGHWDINNTLNDKWPGSNIVYRLRTNNSVAVQPQNPTVTANFTVINNGSSSVTLNADSSRTSVTGATIKSYIWTISPSLNGQTTTTTSSPTLLLQQAGTYNVSLQVEDSSKNKSSITAPPTSVTVTPQNAGTTTPQPKVSFAPAAASPGVTFSADGTIATGIIPVTLAFTANTNIQIFEIVNNSEIPAESSSYTITNPNSSNPSVTFNKAGTYKVVAQANTKSVSDTTSLTVVVLPSATTNSSAVASFIATTPDSKNDRMKINLDATASHSDSDIKLYHWSLINAVTGITESVPTPSKELKILTHRFQNEGSYIVTLTVTDSSEHKATVSDVITVPQLLANFTVTSNANRVEVDASTSTPSDNILTYKWFLDDNQIRAGVDALAKSISIPLEILNDYVVTLLVIDKNNRMDSSSMLVRANAEKVPTAEFTATPSTTVTPGLITISLDASASIDIDGGAIKKYEWNWDHSDVTNLTSKLSISDSKLELKFKDDVNNNPQFKLKVNLIVTDDEGVPSLPKSRDISLNRPTVTLTFPEPNFYTWLGSSVLLEFGKSVEWQSKFSIPSQPVATHQQSFPANSSKAVLKKLADNSDPLGNENADSMNPLQEHNILPNSYPPGDYQLIVSATDNYGLTGVMGSPTIVITPPAITDGDNPVGSIINSNGVFQGNSQSKFYAGLRTGNNWLTTQPPTANGNSSLWASIVVDPVDRPYVSELLIVLIEKKGTWYSKGDKSFQYWDGKVPSPTLLSTKVLPNTSRSVYHLQVWDSSITSVLPKGADPKGDYLLYVGYRLVNNGNIIFNHIPFTFSVVQ